MSKEIAIEKIVLRIGKQEISLSPDEARALMHELEMLLKGSTIYVSSPWIVTYPSAPQYPTITYNEPYRITSSGTQS